MIWVFLFIFAIPWIQILIGKLWKNRTILFKNKWVSFLLFWLLWTPLFFTVSKSLIHPYIMPVMVPIALLITYWWEYLKHKKRIIGIGLIFPLLAVVLYISISFTSKNIFYTNSDKYFIEQHINDDIPIFHWESKSYSGQFYSKGKLKALEDNKTFTEKLSLKEPFLIIIPHKKIKNIKPEALKQLKELESNYNKGIYIFN